MNSDIVERVRKNAHLLNNPAIAPFRDALSLSMQECWNILSYLYDEDDWVTARQIGDELDLNRNSICIYCRALQDAGFPLESKSGKGWRLYDSIPMHLKKNSP